NVDFLYDSLTKKRTFVFPVDGKPTIAMQLLMQLLKDLDRKYKLDDKRLYVGGLSMGGMGTFELVKRKPKMFAAAFPICGGANTATAKKLKRTSWWIFHGLKDDVVSPQFSQQMANAIKATGAEVKLTLYPNANHNSWDSAFAEKELLPWLFSHKK
ncbi:MAG: phospholipase, partial [Gammaproteobacteria bacterium]